MPTRIMVSYLRSDAPRTAAHLCGRLADHFGRENVFFDAASRSLIPAGSSYREWVIGIVPEIDVWAVVIGPNWRGERENAAARIFDDDDPMRFEVALALRREVPVVPLLVDGATMPRKTDLPSDLQALGDREFAVIENDGDVDADLSGVIRLIEAAAERHELRAEAGGAKERVDRVSFSVYAPPAVSPNTAFLLSVWAARAELDRAGDPVFDQRPEMHRRASGGGRLVEAGSRPIKIPFSGDLSVSVQLDGFDIPEPVESLTWEGEIIRVGFTVHAGDLAHRAYPGTVFVTRFGAVLSTVKFEIVVAEAPAQTGPIPVKQSQEIVRSAFASYASEDRVTVLTCVHGIQATGIDVFIDVVTIRQNADWESALRQAIRERDKLYLFWTPAAKASEWVDREWRMALAERGRDFVWLVPLVDPRDAAPPRELADRHANDSLRVHIDYERQRERAQQPASLPHRSVRAMRAQFAQSRASHRPQAGSRLFSKTLLVVYAALAVIVAAIGWEFLRHHLIR